LGNAIRLDNNRFHKIKVKTRKSKTTFYYISRHVDSWGWRLWRINILVWGKILLVTECRDGRPSGAISL